MDENHKPGLEHVVNPYAPPCESSTLEDLYSSLANSGRLKWFYRGLTSAIIVAPTAATDLAVMAERYELVEFRYNNNLAITIISAIAAIACYLKSEEYRWKACDIQSEIENREQEIRLKCQALEEEK